MGGFTKREMRRQQEFRMVKLPPKRKRQQESSSLEKPLSRILSFYNRLKFI